MAESQQDFYSSTYEGFILYLYLCAAFSDYQIRESERHMILDKMQRRGLMSAEEFDKHWYNVSTLFKSHNDYESERFIEKTCRELNIGQEARQRIYNDLKDIIDADGVEDASERVNLFKFKKMLNV
jgi:hypothetical protein